ncbi:MAG: archaeosortase/exosortase family protein, partial [Thermoguttaceae bacterium]
MDDTLDDKALAVAENGDAPGSARRPGAVAGDELAAPRPGARGAALAAVILLPVFLWSYWPTLLDLVNRWNNEADYSHGYLVVPIALGFLWTRRDLYPGASGSVAWLGFIPLLLSIVMRYVGAQWYLGSV